METNNISKDEIKKILNPIAKQYFNTGDVNYITIDINIETLDHITNNFSIQIYSQRTTYRLDLVLMQIFISKAKDYVTFVNGADLKNFHILIKGNQILLNAPIELLE